jgi:formylglycine-generating enzyme required for sulfatase activity
LAIALVSVVALIVFRIETPEGEFVVEADDPRVAITAEKSGGIKLIHRDTGRQYVVKSQKLPEGDYDLLVTDASAGLEFSTRRFTIKAQGNPARVSVYFEKKQRVAAALPRPGTIPSAAIAPFDANRAEQLQKDWASWLDVPVEYTHPSGMKLRLIPPGEFLMGSTSEQIESLVQEMPAWNRGNVQSEGPQRRVPIKHPYYIGIHEVTVGQFRSFVKQTGYKTTAERNGKGGRGWNSREKRTELRPDLIWSHAFVTNTENHPVVLVSREDAEAFCSWLGQADGHRYSLPSEEQWEFACRGGTTTRWYWGDDPAGARQHAWTDDVATSARQMPVGLKAPNRFGLFDVVGNVAEMATAKEEIIFRGGHAGYDAMYLHSATRERPNYSDPMYRNGFRVIREVSKTSSP